MKLEITPELALLVKTLRVQSGIPAKDVAKRLGKSPSYLSKLEGHAIHSIDKSLLRQLLCAASGFDDFYGEALPAAMKLLNGTLTSERVVDQAWLVHFDVIERPVQIPAAMAADMAGNFQEMGISVDELAEFINKNIDSQMPDTFPANQVYRVNSGQHRRLVMRVEIDPEEVSGALFVPNYTTSYFFLYNIVSAMFRQRLYPGIAFKLQPNQAIVLLRSVAEYMARWNVHSLMNFSHFISSDEFIEYQLPLVSGEEGVVEDVISKLKEAIAYDSFHTIESLSVFNETFSWDPAFALKVLEIPFSKLGNISFAHKKELMDEICNLVESYSQMDEFQKRIERY